MRHRDQRRIVAALRDGFGPASITTDEREDRILVHVEGMPDPIAVGPTRVSVPASFPAAVRAGIRLDLQTLRAF